MKKKPNGVQLRKIPNLIDNNFDLIILTRMMVIFGFTRSPTIYTKLITKGSRGDGFTVMVKILAFLPLMVISK